jgi:hypothetical protein
MTHKSANHQPSLLDEETPPMELCAAQRAELAGLLEALLGEIAAMVSVRSGESVDEQDRG